MGRAAGVFHAKFESDSHCTLRAACGSGQASLGRINFGVMSVRWPADFDQMCPGDSASNLAEAGLTPVDFGPNVSRFFHNFDQYEPRWPGIGQIAAEFGRYLGDVDQLRPSAAWDQPNLSEVVHQASPRGDQLGGAQHSTNLGPNSTEVGGKPANLNQHWPEVG